MTQDLDKLIAILEDIAEGRYSNDIMELTGPSYPERIRRIAESMGMMMVKVEAREMRLSELIDELRSLNEQLKQNTIQSIATIANALGARDRYTEGHAQRVSAYAGRLARGLGLPDTEVEMIGIAGILHDIGKIGFSDRIFQNEDTNIPRDMFDSIRKHPTQGAEILKDLNFIGKALDFVRYHHERMDGTGYPYQLQGDAIPLGAQIISVADCFDAITTDRPYQKGKSLPEAFEILRKLSDKSFPHELVEAFIQEIEENGAVVSDIQNTKGTM